jgi:membrane protein implicated in regulation of membrane protease activity
MVRSRQLPLVAAVVATAGTLCAFFGSGTRVETVGWAVTGVALAYIGWTVVRPRVPEPVAVESGSLAPSGA